MDGVADDRHRDRLLALAGQEAQAAAHALVVLAGGRRAGTRAGARRVGDVDLAAGGDRRAQPDRHRSRAEARVALVHARARDRHLRRGHGQLVGHLEDRRALADGVADHRVDAGDAVERAGGAGAGRGPALTAVGGAEHRAVRAGRGAGRGCRALHRVQPVVDSRLRVRPGRAAVVGDERQAVLADGDAVADAGTAHGGQVAESAGIGDGPRRRNARREPS